MAMGRHHGHDEESYGWGPPPWVRRAMRGGFGPPWAGGGPRARRGDVRIGVLSVLAERPMHGYEVIGQLEERSGGRWRPSPGSVYPTLQMLEDEGLVRGQDRDGKRVFEITDAGRETLASRTDETRAPWEAPGGDQFSDMKQAAFQLGAAAMQVAHTGSQEQLDRTKQILDEARKKIYGILSEA